MDLIVFYQLVHRTVQFCVGMVFACVVIWFGASLDNCIEIELRHGIDERDVECFCAQAVANDADIVLCSSHVSRGALVIYHSVNTSELI